MTPIEFEIESAARPMLCMQADVVWTDCFNRLVQLGPAAVAHLAQSDAMKTPCAPDDLRLMLHCSLLRLLARRAGAPPLTANCLETSLDVLHFDLKVDGASLGSPFVPAGEMPALWHDLYPGTVNLPAAEKIDAERDRRTLLAWWQTRKDDPQSLCLPPTLRPNPEFLWPLLARRFADQWTYMPDQGVIRCGDGPTGALIQLQSTDYNLVRAACVILGSSEQASVQDRLIELVASPIEKAAYNARFALRFSRDERIRAVVNRVRAADPKPPAESRL